MSIRLLARSRELQQMRKADQCVGLPPCGPPVHVLGGHLTQQALDNGDHARRVLGILHGVVE